MASLPARHAGDVADQTPPPRPRQRWTITRSAKALHRQVLAPAGYELQGTSCTKNDFLERKVTLYAARFMEPEERTLLVNFTLGWAELAGDRPPELGYIVVGGTLKSEFLQPWSDEVSLSPLLVSGVAGPVLEYLEAPSSPEQFIDQLLAYREYQHPDYMILYAASVHSYLGAWGALLLRDAERCEAALVQARELTLADPVDGQNADWVKRTLEWHREDIALINTEWLTRYNEPRPLSSM